MGMSERDLDLTLICDLAVVTLAVDCWRACGDQRCVGVRDGAGREGSCGAEIELRLDCLEVSLKSGLKALIHETFLVVSDHSMEFLFQWMQICQTVLVDERA